MVQPVGNPLHILTLLYSSTGCHVNEIVRKTGSKDKPHVLDSIKRLEKSNLVETKKLSHKTQKKIKILTPLGHEFAHLIYSIHRYENLYNEFKEAIKTNYELPLQCDKNALKNILLSRGWNKWEVNSYDVWYERIQRYEIESVFAFIHALLAKYASILFKFELNEFAKSILIKIIIETLSKHLDNRFLTEKKTSSTNRARESEELFSKLLKNLSETVEELPWRYSMRVGEYQGTFVEVIKPIKYGKQEAYKLMESIVLFLKSPSELESLIERNKKVDQFIQQSKARRER